MVYELLNKEGLVQFNAQLLSQIKNRLKYKGNVSINAATRTNWDDLAATALAPKGAFVGHLYKIDGAEGESVAINDITYNVGDWIIVVNNVPVNGTGVQVEILGSAAKLFQDVEELPTEHIKENVIYRVAQKPYTTVYKRYALTADATTEGYTIAADGIHTPDSAVIPFDIANILLLNAHSTLFGKVEESATGVLWQVYNDDKSVWLSYNEPADELREYFYTDDQWHEIIAADRMNRALETRVGRVLDPTKPNLEVNWKTDALGNLLPFVVEHGPLLTQCRVEDVGGEALAPSIFFTPIKTDYDIAAVIIDSDDDTIPQIYAPVTPDVENEQEVEVTRRTTFTISLVDIRGNTSETVTITYVPERTYQGLLITNEYTWNYEVGHGESLEDVKLHVPSLVLDNETFTFAYPVEGNLLHSININGDECITLFDIGTMSIYGKPYRTYTLQNPGNGTFDIYFE